MLLFQPSIHRYTVYVVLHADIRMTSSQESRSTFISVPLITIIVNNDWLTHSYCDTILIPSSRFLSQVHLIG